jgi:sugar phosphate isomerase/epimerase
LANSNKKEMQNRRRFLGSLAGMMVVNPMSLGNSTNTSMNKRVFPGDGSAPFQSIVPELKRINSGMVLSLELFNPDYWKMDALTVARTGLQKMKAVIQL